MHSIYESFYSSDFLALFSCLHMKDCENDVVSSAKEFKLKKGYIRFNEQ